MAGFEGACQINRAGRRVDMQRITQHDAQAAEDYARLEPLGIRTVRDGVRWHLVDCGDRFDFSSLTPLVTAAEQAGVQVIWTLCHYGWPEDIDVFSPAFVERFAAYCRQVALFLAERTPGPRWYTPINEISFLSWAAGQVGYMFPFARARAGPLKRNLVRATISGIEAIWSVDPGARFVVVDPVIHAVPLANRPRSAATAARQRASQFEAWDMLIGRRDPELGGHPKYLDVIGANHYYDSQWETRGTRWRRRLAWEEPSPDPRRKPLHQLLRSVYQRYQRPMIISETGHFGAGRGRWILKIAEEVRQAREIGVPVDGVCLYPIIDRPGWDNVSHWHNSGLWDVEKDERGVLQRVLNEPYLRDFERAALTP
jgi:beta-glucosidase/6-phospho-beta-glucosidase/beta-galactosidase